MNGEQKKFLDENGLKILWNQISMHDYPNNAALTSVINAIDANKADKADIPKIDTTLSAAGAAADAKAVGQAIENIELTPGPKGDSGVYVGASAPTDESVNVWINPNGEAIDIPSGGGSGGNANICNFTTTSEQEVNGITVELPTTLNKFYIINFRIQFASGLSGDAMLYSNQGNGYWKGYGVQLTAGTGDVSIFGLFYNNEYLSVGVNIRPFGVMASPQLGTIALPVSPNNKTITFFNNPEGVNFPAGSSISVWGVYEQ